MMSFLLEGCPMGSVQWHECAVGNARSPLRWRHWVYIFLGRSPFWITLAGLVVSVIFRLSALALPIALPISHHSWLQSRQLEIRASIDADSIDNRVSLNAE